MRFQKPFPKPLSAQELRKLGNTSHLAKRAVIIAGGKMQDFDYIRSFVLPTDTIIAADSGYLHAKQMGLTPHIVVGDFDSLGFVPEDTVVYQVSKEKDMTDTELALDIARKQGFQSFLFLAALGTRMDHSLSNIFLLAQLLHETESGQIVDEHNQIYFVNSTLTLTPPLGSFLSLVPITDCHGVTSSGLSYPLSNSSLTFGKSLGISNVVTDTPVTIQLDSGKLLVIVAKD